MHTMETFMKKSGWEKAFAPLQTHPEDGSVSRSEGRDIQPVIEDNPRSETRDIPSYVGGSKASDKRSITPSSKKRSTWYPMPREKNMFYAKQLLDNPVGSDTTFCIGEEQEKFNAHKCILYPRAPRLYELVTADTSPEGADDYFEIPDISKHTFKVLLEHIYAGSLPEISEKDDTFAKDLLLVADRFGCVLLKLWVESEITAKLIFKENAAEWLSCADALSCPLLKEACMMLYAEHPGKVRKSAGWIKVQETPKLLDELLAFLAERVGTSSPFCEHWPVSKLREHLDSLGLDLIGTKAELVKRLKDKGIGAPGLPQDVPSNGGDSIAIDNSLADSVHSGMKKSKTKKSRSNKYRDYATEIAR